MKKIIVVLLYTASLIACKNDKKEAPLDSDVDKVKKEEQKTANDWITLFDGTSTDQWRGYLSDSLYTEWTIEGDALAFTPSEHGGKNIITKEKFTNFILSLEWKISKKGNSGIFWGVFEDKKFPEAYQTGPEIQVLDNNGHPDAKVAGKLHQAGALYDMVEPSRDVVKPAGEWNKCIIKVDHTTNQGSVTMNGTKIVTFPVHGEAWHKMVANSKFKDWEGFGKYKTGHIGLQDHSDKVWYRNIKIKKL